MDDRFIEGYLLGCMRPDLSMENVQLMAKLDEQAMDLRVGPTFEYCPECGGGNDGYSDVVHYATCSKAPQGKRAKMEPTRIDINSLSEQMRRDLGLDLPAAPVSPREHRSMLNAGPCGCELKDRTEREREILAPFCACHVASLRSALQEARKRLADHGIDQP